MPKNLTSVCQSLDALIENEEARIYISGQHALDESLIFGTTDAYLRLARELLKFVVAAQRGEAKWCEMDGIAIQTDGSIVNAFDSCSEVILDNSDLVQTEAQARQLFEHYGDANAQTVSTRHLADYSNEKFQDCNFTDVELTNCKTAGLKINGIALQDLLDCYQQRSSNSQSI